MFTQNKRRKTRNIVLVVFGSLSLILIACIAGYTYSRDAVKREGQEMAEQSMYPTLNIPISSAEPTPYPTVDPGYDPAMAVEMPTESPEPENDMLSDTATLEIIYEYSLCGHRKTITVYDGLAGKTKEELQSEYDGCTVEQFASDHAQVKKVYQMYCPDHYILKSGDNSLQILRTVAGKDEMVVDRVIEGVILPPDEALQNGIVFDSLEAIELYLENVES